jgi:glyoxylase-like metal-dependent hydrolase (beta-lactamase superfamily II)
VAYLKTVFVNLFFYGQPGASSDSWVMIDAGLHGSAPWILAAAEERFGRWSHPSAIVLTHGHFDHVGALRTLLQKWDVPVYAHPLELPYLTGRSAYPPPDPTVGGGAMTALSRFYPRGPYNFADRLQPLPADGSVPGMPGWRWIHTPGHTPGHVALYRESDRTLIAGDAFVTTKQESAYAALTQRPEIHGPPAYFTPDWVSARRSVEQLAALQPLRVATGHGPPMEGDEMLRGLTKLARDFDRLAVPRRGRYVREPAVADERGVVAVPPPVPDPLARIVLGVGVALLAGALLRKSTRAH